MRWSRLAVGGGAAVAGAAAINALAARNESPLPNLIGGTEGWFTWRGHRVAYTRRGAGPNLLLVHAIHAAAWSYEWRHAVDRLAERHTVWTIDQVGFGRSDRPALRYTAALYVALIGDFVEQVVGAPCALVGSSLSGAHVVAAASRSAERFPAVVLVCPTGVTHLASPPTVANDAARATLEAPVVGQALFNALVTKPSMRGFLSQTYQDRSLISPDLLDAYWATTHQPGARHAVAAFVGFQLNLNVRDALRRLEQPLLITWGEQAREVPLSELAAYRTLRPDAEVALFGPCGSLPHDERPGEWCPAVLGFLGRALGAEAVAGDAASDVQRPIAVGDETGGAAGRAGPGRRPAEGLRAAG